MPRLEPDTPATAEHFIKMIDEALLEIQDVYNALEYEMDGLSKAMDFLPAVDTQLKHMKAELLDGTHQFGTADLDYMPMIAPQNTYVLPFKRLLMEINRIHRQGLKE